MVAATCSLAPRLRVAEVAEVEVAMPASVSAAASADFENPRFRESGSSRMSMTCFTPAVVNVARKGASSAPS